MTSSRLTLGALQVETATGRVLRDDEEVARLTTRELALLNHLAARAGRTVSRDELRAEVFDQPASSLSRAVDSAMRRLRVKLEKDPSNPRHLVRVHGTGYRLALTPSAPTLRLLGRDEELAAGRALLAEHGRLVVVGLPGVGAAAVAAALGGEPGATVEEVRAGRARIGTARVVPADLPSLRIGGLRLPEHDDARALQSPAVALLLGHSDGATITDWAAAAASARRTGGHAASLVHAGRRVALHGARGLEDGDAEWVLGAETVERLSAWWRGLPAKARAVGLALAPLRGTLPEALLDALEPGLDPTAARAAGLLDVGLRLPEVVRRFLAERESAPQAARAAALLARLGAEGDGPFGVPGSERRVRALVEHGPDLDRLVRRPRQDEETAAGLIVAALTRAGIRGPTDALDDVAEGILGELRDPARRARVGTAWANVLRWHSREQARRVVCRAARDARIAGRVPLEVTAIVLGLRLAVAPRDLGGDLERALRLAEAEGEPRALAAALEWRATTLETEDLTAAMELYERARALAAAAGDWSGEATRRGNLARVLPYCGRLAEAEAHCRDALDVFRRMGNDRLVALAHSNIGALLAARNHVERAEVELRSVIETAESLRNAALESSTRCRLAWLLYMRDRDEESGAEAERSLACGPLNRTDRGVVFALQGVAALARGDRPAAQERLAAAEATPQLRGAVPVHGAASLLGAALAEDDDGRRARLRAAVASFDGEPYARPSLALAWAGLAALDEPDAAAALRRALDGLELRHPSRLRRVIAAVAEATRGAR